MMNEIPAEFNDSRVDDMNALRESGMEPYPQEYNSPDMEIVQYQERYADVDEPSEEEYYLCGRVRDIRQHGGISFIDISDGTGSLQLIFEQSEASDYELIDHIGLGDVIGAIGVSTRSSTGQLSLNVAEWQMLTKVLRDPFWSSDGNVYDRSLINDRTNALQLQEYHNYVQSRFQTINTVREILTEQGLMSVDTPILHDTAGGANATPFTTYSNGVDREFDLRIAPELYLKMLVVAGFTDIFEIGHSFRNEDVDATHSPEFITVEVYQAYTDYNDMMDLVENVVREVAVQVRGETNLIVDGREIDISEWERREFSELIEHYTDIDNVWNVDISTLQNMTGEEIDSRGDLLMEVYDQYVEPELEQPTFIIHHPSRSTPLCETVPDDDRILQRFEAVIGGVEIANGYTELRDPVVQAERLYQQIDNIDEYQSNFVESIALGLPPCGGVGIGLDRLALMTVEADSFSSVLPYPLTSRY